MDMGLEVYEGALMEEVSPATPGGGMAPNPGPVVAALLLCPTLPTLTTENGHVARIVDGETLDIAINRRIEAARLFAVGTPEIVQSPTTRPSRASQASETAERPWR